MNKDWYSYEAIKAKGLIRIRSLFVIISTSFVLDEHGIKSLFKKYENHDVK